MTEQTQPTDAELEALAEEHLDAVHQFGRLWIEGQAAFARAVLEKWGTPAGAGEPVGKAMSLPGISGFTQACFHSDVVPLGTKLYTAQQPTQAQAGAVPLKYARLHAISLDYSDSEDECTGFRDGWRAAEKHHGIKGADHA